LANPTHLFSRDQSEYLQGSAVTRHPEMAADWASVEDALDIVRNTKADLLIIGPEGLAMDVVRWVIADVPTSIVVGPSDEGKLWLPRLPLPGITLVVRDIDELNAEGQASLLAWLESACDDEQIVCTASGLLLSMVNDGEFDRRLYYRLNNFCIKLETS
jgi:hypothetical protein